MNDYTEYPLLMWMLTTATLGVAVVGALIPLVAGLTTLTKKQGAATKEGM